MQFELQERRILIIFHGIFGVAMRFLISQFFFCFFVDSSVSFLCLMGWNDFL